MGGILMFTDAISEYESDIDVVEKVEGKWMSGLVEWWDGCVMFVIVSYGSETEAGSRAGTHCAAN